MGVKDGPKIVTNGLILNFDASDRTCYPYTNGLYLYDLTPNNFVGQFINNPHWGQGNEGYIAFRQNNTDDYFSLLRIPNLEYIEVFYSRIRIHSANDYLSSAEFEALTETKALQKTA